MSVVGQTPQRPASAGTRYKEGGLLAALAKWKKTTPLAPLLTRTISASSGRATPPGLPSIPERRPAAHRSDSTLSVRPTSHRSSSGTSVRPVPSRTSSGISTALSEFLTEAPATPLKRPTLKKRDSGSWESQRRVRRPAGQSEAIRLEHVPVEWTMEKIGKMCAQYGRVSMIDMACDGHDPPGEFRTVRVFYGQDFQAAIALECLAQRFKSGKDGVTVKWDKWWAN